MKAAESPSIASWGRPISRARAPYENIRTERTREGRGPTKAVKTEDKKTAAIRAPLRPRRGAARTATIAARMPRCWPDSARTWEHPARRKASESSESRSSRTPRTRASRSGPPAPPIRRRLSAMRERREARRREKPFPHPSVETDESSAKTAQPGPYRSGSGFPATRSTDPAWTAGAPRAAITATFPRAETLAPSREPAARRERNQRRPPPRKGEESESATPSTQATFPAGRPRDAGEAASAPPRTARKARRKPAETAHRRPRPLAGPGRRARAPAAAARAQKAGTAGHTRRAGT